MYGKGECLVKGVYMAKGGMHGRGHAVAGGHMW